jgi:hypothetical protein
MPSGAHDIAFLLADRPDGGVRGDTDNRSIAIKIITIITHFSYREKV